MPTKTSRTAKETVKPTRAAKTPPAPEPRAALPPILKGTLLPAKSVDRAKSLFENFTLSKFAKDSIPPNYVPADKKPAATHPAEKIQRVQDFQRKKLEQHLHKLTNMDTPNLGMKIALPKEKLKNSPSYNEKAGTIDLKDLMKLITGNMRGTEFYNKGNPILNRLALRDRVKKLIPDAKRGEKK
jgi:hypothetical protein